MTPFKKVLLFCHRWLGFISGLVVFIVSITGCIFCFQDEIQDAVYDYRTVQNTGKPYVQPSQLINEVKKAYPKASPDFIYYYGAERPAGVLANTGKDGYEYVFLTPTPARSRYTEKPQTNFFIIVEYIHLIPAAAARNRALDSGRIGYHFYGDHDNRAYPLVAQTQNRPQTQLHH
jgi:uncharacterized iron-regulated membrane protein